MLRRNSSFTRLPAGPVASRWSRFAFHWVQAASLLVVGAGLLGLSGGCAGYRLGPTNGMRAGEKSIQVNPVVNSTLEPRLGPVVNQALRKEIQRDGTFRLNTHGNGDVVVNTELVRFHRRELAFQPEDTLTPQDYELDLYAHVTATDRTTGVELLDREVHAWTTVRVGSDLINADLASSERQARPLLADDLARQISSLIVDGDW